MAPSLESEEGKYWSLDSASMDEGVFFGPYCLFSVFLFMILRYPGVMISLRVDDLSASRRGILFCERPILSSPFQEDKRPWNRFLGHDM